MKILPYRVLRNRPGEFEETLASEGTVILEKNGEQIALVLDATKQTIESLVRLASQVKALAALSEIRRQSRERGLDKLSAEEIRAEIEAVRASHRG